MSPFDELHMTPIYLSQKLCLSFAVFKSFVKSRKTFLPHVHLALPVDAIHLEFYQELWCQSPRVPGQPRSIVCMMKMFRHFDKTPACEERTGRRPQHIPH